MACAQSSRHKALVGVAAQDADETAASAERLFRLPRTSPIFARTDPLNRPNCRVRTRTHGDVGGGASRGVYSPDHFSQARDPIPWIGLQNGLGPILEGGTTRGGRSSPEMEQAVALTISVDDANK